MIRKEVRGGVKVGGEDRSGEVLKLMGKGWLEVL